MERLYPPVVGLLLLLAGTALIWKSGPEPIERILRRIGAFLVRRNLFRVPLSRDIVRLDLLRILTGLVLLHRTLNTAYFIFGGADPLSMKVVCAITLTVAAMFAFGIATPLVSATLLFLNATVFDAIMRTSTLGSDVLAMMLLVFTFLPAGTSLSIDSVIIRRGLPGAKVLRALYAAVGPPTFLRAVISKAACLLSYSLLCFYSASLHMHEAFWLSGDVGYIVLASSYFNHYYLLFRTLFEDYYISIILARTAMIGMLVWYFGFGIFVVVGGVLRWFAIGWAFLFFLVSTFLLQLGWLGYYEFLFLAILFWNRTVLNVSGRSTLEVIYDDRCNLCDRTVRFLRVMDIFQVIELRPLSWNLALIARLGLSHTDALKDLYGHDPRSHRVYSGYDFYLEISKRLLLMWPAFAIMLLGRVLFIGPAVYRIIADRRVRLFGVCERPPEHPRLDANPLLGGRSNPLPRAFFGSFATIHIIFALFFLAKLPPFLFWSPPLFLLQLTRMYALTQINVFNQDDLRMNEHWFIIRVVRPDGSKTLLPFTGSKGERLAWHGSDRVYFGNSLAWRRAANARADICFEPKDAAEIQEIIGWHQWRSKERDDRYSVVYFVQPRPRVTLAGPPFFVLEEPRTTCTASFDSDGKLLTLHRE